MYYLFEIIKLKGLDSSLLVSEASFVYKAQLKTETVADYITSTFGMSDDTNKVDVSIQDVQVAFETYTKYSTQALCESNEKSFYWDDSTQTIYIHYEHTVNPFSVETEVGQVLGFSDDDVRYFNDVPYSPLVVSFPNIIETVDALSDSTMTFNDISVTLKNNMTYVADEVRTNIVFGLGSNIFGKGSLLFGKEARLGENYDQSGLFDTDPKLYGMSCRILRGEDGDSYEDLISIVENNISTYSLDIESDIFTIEGTDKRRQLEVDFPTATFSGLTGEAEDSNDEIIPDGFGDVIQVKAFPYQVNSGSVVFRWATIATSITQVYVIKDDKITAVSHGTFQEGEGYFFLGDANAYIDGDNTKGLRDVYVTGTMRPETNPADIIAKLNDTILGIAYDSDNYNTTEWESESTSLDDVSLYMDDTSTLQEWIELLQGWSNRPFRYEHQDKRTLRVYDPDRTTSFSLESIMLDLTERDSSGEDFYTSVEVKYNHNERLDTWESYTAETYKTDAYREHRQYKTLTIETGLTSLADATDRADFMHLDTYQTRPLFTATVRNEFITPRIWDFGTIDTKRYHDTGSRDLNGVVSCGIISIQPIPSTDEYTIVFRQGE